MNTKRRFPWLALVIVAEYLFILTIVMYTTVKNLTAYALAFIVLQNPKVGAKFIGDFPMMILMPLIEVFVLSFILAAIIYGRRLVMHFVLLVQIYLFFNGVINIFSLLFKGQFKLVGSQLVGSVFILGLVWVTYIVLKHPYYNGTGENLDWRSWQGWKRFFLGKRDRLRVEEMTTF